MTVKVKTWIKIAEPTLISVLINRGSLLFQFPTLISFLTSMFSLGMSIGKKNHVLMKARARLFNAIQMIKLHVTMWQLTQQNYIITQFQTKKSGNWLTCFNFWGLEVQRNRYGKQLQLMKVDSLRKISARIKHLGKLKFSTPLQILHAVRHSEDAQKCPF